MRDPVRSFLVIAVSLTFVFSVPVAFANASGPPSVHAPSAPPLPGIAAHEASTPPHFSGSSTSSSYLSREQTILSTLHRRGVPDQDIHLPNLAAEGPHAGHQVSETYPAAPAPMGVADIGLRNVSGSIVPYEFNSTSVEGSITLTHAQSLYVDGDGPDMFGIQLNSVLNNVTLFGNSTYQFWTQNFAIYTSSSGELVFGDNVWNFTNVAGLLPANALYEWGPNGTVVPPVFYYAEGPTFTVHYPFTVSLYLNSTTLADRPAVFFNYSLSSATVRAEGTFDFVVFNSSAGTPTRAATPAEYQVNGYSYNGAGLINDIELVVVGNDDGDTTTFFQMNATLSIAYWNSTVTAYRPVPSAYGVGADTGETSDGVEVYYNTSGGVDIPLAHMIIGPSFLNGLWNVSKAAGSRMFEETQTPANAFLFVTPGTSFNESTAQWVPTIPFGTATANFGIPNDGRPYFFEWLLSDYDRVGATYNTGANTTDLFTRTLTHSWGAGVYTPLLAWGNDELASISRSGAGTEASPYALEDNQRASLDPVFSPWNDYLFPIFPGLLLVDTTDWVTVTPPSFEINLPPEVPPPFCTLLVPTTNDLQLEFDHVSNVSLVNAPEISGWLSSCIPTAYPVGDVIFWNSTGNLVAGNTFHDQSSALALYGGTNNTVWGNSFLATSTAVGDPAAIMDDGNLTGIYEAESGDLLYNNYFNVTIPAYTPTFDPLLCQNICESASYTDTWNVSLEPAAVTATFLGTSLTGSIIQSWYQGGNFWSNYGTQSNPYGSLPLATPYNDSGWITNGGDFVPLLPFTLYPVTFTEGGLASGTAWNVTALNVTTAGTEDSITIWSPNGTYNFAVSKPTGYSGPLVYGNGSFTVRGNSVSVFLTFFPLEAVTFSETGLIPGTTWTVRIPEPNGPDFANGSSTSTTLVLELPGNTTPFAYSGLASAFDYQLVTWSTLVGESPVSVSVSFIPSIDLEFTQNTLPAGTAWTVELQQGDWSVRVSSFNASIVFLRLNTPTGLVNYTVSAAGYTADPGSGSIVLPEVPTIGVVFSPVNGTLVAHVAPAGATLFVNGHPVVLAANGTVSMSLGAGLYSIEVTAAGYLAYFNNVSVTSGHTMSLTISLTSIPAAPAASISPVAWAAIGLLATVAVVLGLIALAYRSRGRRPPPKPVVLPPGTSSPEKSTWSEGESPSPGK